MRAAEAAVAGGAAVALSVAVLTGRWPIIYTTTDWWRESTSDTRGFPHDPLWLAQHGWAPYMSAHQSP